MYSYKYMYNGSQNEVSCAHPGQHDLAASPALWPHLLFQPWSRAVLQQPSTCSGSSCISISAPQGLCTCSLPRMLLSVSSHPRSFLVIQVMAHHHLLVRLFLSTWSNEDTSYFLIILFRFLHSAGDGLRLSFFLLITNYFSFYSMMSGA